MNGIPMCRQDFMTTNNFCTVFVKATNAKQSGDICCIENVCNDEIMAREVYLESTIGVPVILLQSTVYNSRSCYENKITDFEVSEIIVGCVLRKGMTFRVREEWFGFEVKENDYFYLNFEENKVQKEREDCKRFFKMKVVQELYPCYIKGIRVRKYQVIVWYDQT